MVNKPVRVAVDPVTIVLKECITMSTAMRKYSTLTSQSGMAAILGGGSDDIFISDSFATIPQAKQNDPLLSGFIQLKLMLDKLESLENIDSLTVLQPFLLVIRTSTISGYITSLALNSLQKFLTTNIITEHSKNYVAAYREVAKALTHCRFEGISQMADDSVLLKVVILLRSLVNSLMGDVLSDSIVHGILQTIMSLACNKRRTEVLRKAAETTMISLTVKIFSKLDDIDPTLSRHIYINDEAYANNTLKSDTVGAKISMDDSRSELSSSIGPRTETADVEEPTEITQRNEGAENIESDIDSKLSVNDLNIKSTSALVLSPTDENYGFKVICQYLNMLLSIVIPENINNHGNFSSILSFQLLNTAIELSGGRFLSHPRLFSLVADPIFKSLFFVIQNSNKLSLVQAAMELFTTIVIVFGENVHSQVELTLNCILDLLKESRDTTDNNGKNKPEEKEIKSLPIKELLLEQLSLLWTCSSNLFIKTFVDFDCSRDRSDLATKLLKTLAKMVNLEPSSQSMTPISLDGICSFVDEIHTNLNSVDRLTFLSERKENIKLRQRERKTKFIKCVEAFNEKPKKGIPLLIESSFLTSDKDEDLAQFLFENNTRINKRTIGLLLSDPNKISLLKMYMNLFDFKGFRVDEAIRMLLTKFRLPGESQQIERIIEEFSSRYANSQNYQSNDTTIYGNESEGTQLQPDSDSVFILSYSIIMLNTDLHNPQVKEHMSFEDYSSNLKGCYNKNDFPFWYLDKIYASIRDKEIVMPEEHHGNEKWFEDAWNNLISSNTVITNISSVTSTVTENLNSIEKVQFGRLLFKNVGAVLINAIFKTYMSTSDEHRSSRVIQCIEKCASIASYYNYKNLFNELLRHVVRITTLTNPENPSPNKIQYNVEEIPLVRIDFEETRASVPVSTLAMRLGRSEKAQLCTILLFSILQNNTNSDIITVKIWTEIIQVVLNLYENLLITPDIFGDLQQKLKLGTLPRPQPDFVILKTNENKGILSTFASYLKGDEEPTDEEIEYAKIAINCVKTSNIPSSIFGNDINITPTIIKLLLESIEYKKTDENQNYFEPEMLFLVEISVSLFPFCKNEKELGNFILSKLSILSRLENLSNETYRRFVAYEVLLLSILDEKEQYLTSLINDKILASKQIFSPKFFANEAGSKLLDNILYFSEIDNYKEELLNNKGFWTLLNYTTKEDYSSDKICKFLEDSIRAEKKIINKNTIEYILEIFENRMHIVKKQKVTVEKSDLQNSNKNDFKVLLDGSEVTERWVSFVIALTGERSVSNLLTVDRIIKIIQTLFFKLVYSEKSLRSSILTAVETILTANIEYSKMNIKDLESVIELGIVTELNKRHKLVKPLILDVLIMLQKVFVYYLKKGITDDETFLKILNVFNKYVDSSEVEVQVQKLITEKKEIERQLKGTSESEQVSGSEEDVYSISNKNNIINTNVTSDPIDDSNTTNNATNADVKVHNDNDTNTKTENNIEVKVDDS